MLHQGARLLRRNGIDRLRGWPRVGRTIGAIPRLASGVVGDVTIGLAAALLRPILVPVPPPTTGSERFDAAPERARHRRRSCRRVWHLGGTSERSQSGRPLHRCTGAPTTGATFARRRQASVRRADYAVEASFWGGVETFPLYVTIGADPTLVVSIGPTGVPPIQLPDGVTAGGAVVLSFTTSAPW